MDHFKGIDLCKPMPNAQLVFHNKLPKSGSTTFFQLLVAIAAENDFDLIHLHPCFDPNNKTGFVDLTTGISFPEDFDKDPKFCKHSLQVSTAKYACFNHALWQAPHWLFYYPLQYILSLDRFVIKILKRGLAWP